MPRLCNDRSRPYPGRPVRQAVQLTLDSIWPGNMPEDRAGVSRGHSSSPMVNEGPNPEQGKGPVSSTIAMNPSGGASGRRVADKPNPNANLRTGISFGMSRKGPWRLSRTLATQTGMITPWRDSRIKVWCLSKISG